MFFGSSGSGHRASIAASAAAASVRFRRDQEARRVHLSLLFADVRGSTTLAEGMGAEAFSQLMARFYGAAAAVVDERDGIVDKFVGDGLVALFIPGFVGPDHAAVAISAARELLAATGHGHGDDEPWIPVGAAVHTGNAYVGSVGEGDALDFTALGDPVNTAARLAERAGAGEILVSDAAATAAGLDTEGLEETDAQPARKGREHRGVGCLSFEPTGGSSSWSDCRLVARRVDDCGERRSASAQKLGCYREGGECHRAARALPQYAACRAHFPRAGTANRQRAPTLQHTMSVVACSGTRRSYGSRPVLPDGRTTTRRATYIYPPTCSALHPIAQENLQSRSSFDRLYVGNISSLRTKGMEWESSRSSFSVRSLVQSPRRLCRETIRAAGS